MFGDVWFMWWFVVSVCFSLCETGACRGRGDAHACVCFVPSTNVESQTKRTKSTLCNVPLQCSPAMLTCTGRVQIYRSTSPCTGALPDCPAPRHYFISTHVGAHCQRPLSAHTVGAQSKTKFTKWTALQKTRRQRRRIAPPAVLHFLLARVLVAVVVFRILVLLCLASNRNCERNRPCPRHAMIRRASVWSI